MGENLTIRRNTSNAFTLIEILVVISIIALLIAILLPSLNNARAQSKRTVCMTRLRTLGQGLAMYADENRDRLVPGRMPKQKRIPYGDNLRDDQALGNEAFNLDPPIVDVRKGEMAGFGRDDHARKGVRTALHERHLGTGAVLWLDGHTTTETLKSSGYEVDDKGRVTYGNPERANNRMWTVDQTNHPWTSE